MASVNKVILIGNLGADPELRTTQGGQSVASLRIATTDAWTDKGGGRQERTEWHAVTVWGKTAENCGKFLAKGRQVYVEGRLQSREYQDKEGQTRKVWEVVADSVVFLGGGATGEPGWGSNGRGEKQASAPGAGGGWGGGWGDNGKSKGASEDDDPIPF